MRYFADIHGGDFAEDGPPQAFVFDGEDGGAECCGPFHPLDDPQIALGNAQIAAQTLNENDALEDGVRPHQIQHALERELTSGR